MEIQSFKLSGLEVTRAPGRMIEPRTDRKRCASFGSDSDRVANGGFLDSYSSDSIAPVNGCALCARHGSDRLRIPDQLTALSLWFGEHIQSNVGFSDCACKTAGYVTSTRELGADRGNFSFHWLPAGWKLLRNSVPAQSISLAMTVVIDDCAQVGASAKVIEALPHARSGFARDQPARPTKQACANRPSDIYQRIQRQPRGHNFMILKHKSTRLFAACVALTLSTFAYAETTITSLPYTASSSGETYVLQGDLSFGGTGSALRITGDNITLDGNGHSISYCNGGLSDNQCIGINLEGTNGVTIRNVRLNQGGYSFPDGGSGTAIRGTNESNVTIDYSTFNLRAYGGASTVFGVNVDTNGSGSRLSNSEFNITGSGPIQAIDNSGSDAWVVEKNRITATSLRRSGTYAKLIDVGSNSQYIENDITVDSDSEYVNIFVSWGSDNAKILRNTINYASDHGRPILLDNGSSGIEVADNFIRITSQNTSDHVVYAIRFRSDTSDGSSNHYIHHNTIDTTGANKTFAISGGGGDYVNPGHRIEFNEFISSSRPIDFYNDTVADTDFSCNMIRHTGTGGYAITVWGSEHQNIRFSNNKIETNRDDNKMVSFGKNQNNSGAWNFCATIDGEDSIAGNNTNGSAVNISQSGCSAGYPQCYTAAGARLEMQADPKEPTQITVQ